MTAISWKMMSAVWVIVSSMGFTYSFLAERNRRLTSMKEMSEGLRRLGFYISRWQLPLEEAFEIMGKEETGALSDLYRQTAECLKNRNTSDLGDFWKEKSNVYLRPYALPGPVMGIWCGSFLDVAPLPEEEQRRLDLKAEQIEKICGELEEKYRQERRPLMAAGFCAGVVFCLLMW